MHTRTWQPSALAVAGMITGVSFLAGLLFNYFFVETVPGISFPLFVAFLLGGLCALAHVMNKPIRKDVLWLTLPVLFFSTMVFVRESDLLTALNILATMVLLLLVAAVFWSKGLTNFSVNNYAEVFILPLRFFTPMLRTVSSLLTPLRTTNNQKTVVQVLKGIAITLPILAIFVALFYSADLIFKKYISYVVTIDLEPETLARIVVVVIVTLITTGAYSYIFQDRTQTTATEQRRLVAFGHIENSILLGSVNVLFLIFIVVQLAYFFGGEQTIIAQGFTYAEYARRGFFELIAVAVIAFLLLLTTEKYIAKHNDLHTRGFLALSTMLVVQVLCIMASAYMRLALYEAAYGFTTLRLYSHAFLILLAIIFCVLLYKIYKDHREHTFLFRLFLCVVLFLAVMNILNPDAFITRRNAERFATTGKIDLTYIRQLSDDAVPATLELFAATSGQEKKEVAGQLFDRMNEKAQAWTHWPALNISRSYANALLDEKVSEFIEYVEPKSGYGLKEATQSTNGL